MNYLFVLPKAVIKQVEQTLRAFQRNSYRLALVLANNDHRERKRHLLNVKLQSPFVLLKSVLNGCPKSRSSLTLGRIYFIDCVLAA